MAEAARKITKLNLIIYILYGNPQKINLPAKFPKEKVIQSFHFTQEAIQIANGY